MAQTPIKGKVLIIMSSSDKLPLKEGKQESTGYFLSELGKPLIKLLEEGYEVVFANPTGTLPTQDPLSNSLIWFLGNYKERQREHKVIERMKVEANFAHPRKFSDISNEELNQFVGIFIPGGHAPMVDLHDDKDLGRILMHFHDRKKPTGAICHGPAALLSTRSFVGQEFPYKGYKAVAYSNTEDALNETMWWGTLKFKLVDELEKAGITMQEGLPMGSHVIVHEELVTGQNPSSAGTFGDAFVKKLNEAVAKNPV